MKLIARTAAAATALYSSLVAFDIHSATSEHHELQDEVSDAHIEIRRAEKSLVAAEASMTEQWRLVNKAREQAQALQTELEEAEHRVDMIRAQQRDQAQAVHAAEKALEQKRAGMSNMHRRIEELKTHLTRAAPILAERQAKVDAAWENANPLKRLGLG